MAENPKNAAAQRRWRRTKRGREYMREYNRKTVEDRVQRYKAHREMAKKVGKSKIRGKSVHHKNGNVKDNSGKNLQLAKRYHGRRKGIKNKKKIVV